MYFWVALCQTEFSLFFWLRESDKDLHSSTLKPCSMSSSYRPAVLQTSNIHHIHHHVNKKQHPHQALLSFSNLTWLIVFSWQKCVIKLPQVANKADLYVNNATIQICLNSLLFLGGGGVLCVYVIKLLSVSEALGAPVVFDFSHTLPADWNDRGCR